ncbi:hypothetical protein ACX0MV_14380 [Pseudomonas borbori]
MNLPDNASRRDMRKALLRMRLELSRQELRHEALVMLQPLRQAQQFSHRWREELGNSTAPFWVAGGALALAAWGIKQGKWRSWVRVALIAFPLLRRNQPRRSSPPATAAPDPMTGDNG